VKRMLQLARAKPRYRYRRIGLLLREESNDVWCWDFVFDRTASGSQLKWLSVVDEYTRECRALKVDRGITGENVIDTLSELFAMRGVPRHIRSNNGPEFIAQTLRRWLKQVGVGKLYIEPGSLRRTATPKASTGGSSMSSWRWRSSRASGMPGRSQLLGEMNVTPSGLTARWVIGPRPGSPPRVRLPPRPRPRLQPHTLVALVNPVPEPSYPLVQQIQPGQNVTQRKRDRIDARRPSAADRG
jgi:hypothetical protein